MKFTSDMRRRDGLVTRLVAFLFALSVLLIMPVLKINNWCQTHDHLALEDAGQHVHEHENHAEGEDELCVSAGSEWVLSKQDSSPAPVLLEIIYLSFDLDQSSEASGGDTHYLSRFLRPDIQHGHPPVHSLRTIVLLV